MALELLDWARLTSLHTSNTHAKTKKSDVEPRSRDQAQKAGMTRVDRPSQDILRGGYTSSSNPVLVVAAASTTVSPVYHSASSPSPLILVIHRMMMQQQQQQPPIHSASGWMMILSELAIANVYHQAAALSACSPQAELSASQLSCCCWQPATGSRITQLMLTGRCRRTKRYPTIRSNREITVCF